MAQDRWWEKDRITDEPAATPGQQDRWWDQDKPDDPVPEDSFLRGVGLGTRDVALPVAGATAGALLGAPAGGVGAIPGAIAGGTAAALVPPAIDIGTRAYNLVARGVNRVAGREVMPAYEGPSGREMVDRAIDPTGLPRPRTERERAISRVSRAAVEAPFIASQMGAAAATMAPSVTQGALQAAANAPVAQGVAAGAGVAADEAQRQLGVENPLYRIPANILTAALAGAPAASMENSLVGNYGTSMDIDLIDYAARNKLPLTAGDAGNATMRGLEDASLKIPGSGRRAFLEQQAGAVQGQIDNATEGLRPGNLGAGGAFTPGEIIIRDLGRQYGAAKGAARAAYDAVDTQLNQVPGSEAIRLDRFSSAARDLLDEFPALANSPDIPVSARNTLQAAASAAANDEPIATTYTIARRISSAIAQLARQADRQAAASGSEVQAGALRRVLGAINDDFEQWGLQLDQVNPAASQAFREAQRTFREQVVPFRADRTIYRAASDALRGNEEQVMLQADTIGNYVTQPGRGGRADLTMRLLGPEGREAARYQLVDRARQSAVDQTLNGNVAPKRFERGLNLDDAGTRTILNTDQEALANVTNAARYATAANRAPMYASNPQTGAQLLPVASTGAGGVAGYTIGASMGVSPAGMALIGAGVPPTMARLITSLSKSPAVQRYLAARGMEGTAGSPAVMFPWAQDQIN